MMTFDEICELVCDHFKLDCDSEDYSITFILDSDFEYNYALIEWHIIDSATKQDFGPTFAIISQYCEIIECPCEFGKSDKDYREEVYDYLGELRSIEDAKEWERIEIQAEWDEYEIREANRQFNDMMNDNDAWGNID